MKYWLMKSEPNVFSIDDLFQRPQQTEPWEGVRNYQARNMLRDQMKPADLAFFYHSSCELPGIVGVVEIICEGYPDPTAFNPLSQYYDPQSTRENPRWFLVDIKFKEKFKRKISLPELRHYPELANMKLLQKGNRLSIMEISKAQWLFINSLTRLD